MEKMSYYQAVVETGNRSVDAPTRWETRATCGHRHKTPQAAYDCLNNLRNRHKEHGMTVESALWCNGVVHRGRGQREGR